MNRQPDDLDQADVESLLAMARVHLEATGGRADESQAAREHSVEANAVSSALGSLHHARLLYSQQNVVGPTRFAFPKRVVMRFSRLFTTRLVAAGMSLSDAVESTVKVHSLSLDDVERLSNSLRAQVATVEVATQEAIDTLASSVLGGAQVPESATATALARFESRVSLLDGRIAELERDREHDRREIQRLRAHAGGPGASGTSAGGAGSSDIGAGGSAALDDAGYVEFERRFRGAPSDIKERQLDALRFVEQIAGSSAPLLDIGCGRGEWLALLRDAGIAAYGVDASEGMVADAQALELDARCEDALTHLRDLEADSLQAVSAFHFAEHVPLGFLTQVLDAALRALVPGGLLLLETPNPTNLVVGAASFYLDPTHLRQLHPDFLGFLVESRGFTDVEVHFVHPTIDSQTLVGDQPAGEYDPRLNRVVESAEWALFGPQDYVVVARRGEASA